MRHERHHGSQAHCVYALDLALERARPAHNVNMEHSLTNWHKVYSCSKMSPCRASEEIMGPLSPPSMTQVRGCSTVAYPLHVHLLHELVRRGS